MEELNDIFRIDPSAQQKSFKRGAILQRRGELNLKTIYVLKGLLRSYIIDSNGREHIFTFAPEKWIIADVESLEFDQPSELFIDCVEDSEVLIFNRDKLPVDNIDHDVISKTFKLLYRRMGILQRRIIMQMSLPAADRYSYFLETYPQLPNRVPQHMIASYLGITPQALSTIRRKIAQAS